MPKEQAPANAASVDHYKWFLTDVCQNVHGAVTGGGEPMSDAELVEAHAWLLYRIQNWTQPAHGCGSFDRAMLLLAGAACGEAYDELKRRGLSK